MPGLGTAQFFGFYPSGSMREPCGRCRDLNQRAGRAEPEERGGTDATGSFALLKCKPLTESTLD